MRKEKFRLLTTLFISLLFLFGLNGLGQAKELTPAQLGEKAGDIYFQAMTDLTETLKDMPPATEVEDKVNALKENTIKQLVEIGHKREAMAVSDRSAMDSKLRMKVKSLYKDPVWKAYSEALNHYRKDKGLYDTIANFNIITQYSNFDLLKKQAPKEAARFGIK